MSEGWKEAQRFSDSCNVKPHVTGGGYTHTRVCLVLEFVLLPCHHSAFKVDKLSEFQSAGE